MHNHTPTLHDWMHQCVVCCLVQAVEWVRPGSSCRRRRLPTAPLQRRARRSIRRRRLVWHGLFAALQCIFVSEGSCRSCREAAPTRVLTFLCAAAAKEMTCR